MWSRPIAATAATATIIAMVAVAPAARAGGPGSPLYGDLNGDGLADRARLGAARRSCLVLAEFARPGGGYFPPRGYPYGVPGNNATTVCPDLGVAVDLDAAPPSGSGVAELVVGWYEGNLGRPGYDLLVLRAFVVTAVLSAIRRPSYIGLADFNGDRRPDPYLWTDQGQGFASYLNLGDGTLHPGPVRFCAGQLHHQLADFDRDGATDLAVAYLDRCGDGARGVAVVLDDGRTIGLQFARDDRSSWTLHVLNADRNGVPDVLTYHQPTGQRRSFLGTGNGAFVRSPLAVRDTVTVAATQATAVPVLANDWASRRARVSVVVPPVHGSAQVGTGGTIVYRPGAASGLADQFVYRVTQDGNTSDARVLVRIIP